MKLQDILFLFIALLLLLRGSSKLAGLFSLVCIAISGILFYFSIFFTAQRLAMYACVFALMSVILFIIKLKK